MHQRIITLLMVAALGGCYLSAQDYDDIYYDSSQSKQKKEKISSSENVSTPSSSYSQEIINERDVDEYNRRGDNSTYFASQPDSIAPAFGKTDEEELEDYAYTQRIRKFYNPTVIIESNDPLLYDMLYTSVAPMSISFNVFSPYYWNYWSPRWNYYSSWSWGYDPWYSPYWGWGGGYYPSWGYYPHYHHHGYYPNWTGPSYNNGNGGRRPFGYGSVGNANSGRRPSNSNVSRPSYSPNQENGRRPNYSSPAGRRPNNDSRPNYNNNSDNNNYRRPSYNNDNNSRNESPSYRQNDSYRSPSRGSVGSSSGGSRGGFGGGSSGGGGRGGRR